MENNDYTASETPADLVIEGGGVKGIALAGAVVELGKRGYRVKNVAGTSAGAMIAALLAAGYTGDEIQTEIKKIDYKKFLGENLADKFGAAGKGLSLLYSFGIYNCDYIENFIGALLARKGKMVFGDLPKWTPNGQTSERCRRLHNLCVTATDLTTGRLLVLPDDLVHFGIDPETFSIAKAVRISISFPLFFEPTRLTDKDRVVHYMVDGGLLSSYPAFILDDDETILERPVIGIRLFDDTPLNLKADGKDNFVNYLKSIVETLTKFQDEVYTERTKGDKERTVFVCSKADGKTVKTMDFNIKPNEVDALFNNGIAAAQNFLSVFNFKDWLKKYRSVGTE